MRPVLQGQRIQWELSDGVGHRSYELSILTLTVTFEFFSRIWFDSLG
jgi:hypothetical protein